MVEPIAVRPSWLRRVIPKGYATGTLHLAGTAPLLMNSPDADRESDLYRAFVLLSQKSRKTLDDESRLREMEWELRLYLDPEIGPYLPARVIKGVLMAAGGKFKKGATLGRAFIPLLYRIPLEYDGPRDQAGLWDAGYRYSTMVQNAGFGSGRVIRCRPMFPQWAINAEFAFDPEEVDPDTFEAIVERSQSYGLADYRPAKGGDFGAFSASVEFSDTVRKSREGLAVKPRNGVDEAAHEATRARILVEV